MSPIEKKRGVIKDEEGASHGADLAQCLSTTVSGPRGPDGKALLIMNSHTRTHNTHACVNMLKLN